MTNILNIFLIELYIMLSLTALYISLLFLKKIIEFIKQNVKTKKVKSFLKKHLELFISKIKSSKKQIEYFIKLDDLKIKFSNIILFVFTITTLFLYENDCSILMITGIMFVFYFIICVIFFILYLLIPCKKEGFAIINIADNNASILNPFLVLTSVFITNLPIEIHDDLFNTNKNTVIITIAYVFLCIYIILFLMRFFLERLAERKNNKTKI